MKPKEETYLEEKGRYLEERREYLEEKKKYLKEKKNFTNCIVTINGKTKINVKKLLFRDSRRRIKKMSLILEKMKHLFAENGWQALREEKIIKSLTVEQELDKPFIVEALKDLLREGYIYMPKPDTVQFVH